MKWLRLAIRFLVLFPVIVVCVTLGIPATFICWAFSDGDESLGECAAELWALVLLPLWRLIVVDNNS